MHSLIIPSQLLVILIEELSAHLLDLLEFLFIPGFSLLSLPVYVLFGFADEPFKFSALVFQLLLKIFFGTCKLLLRHDLISFDARL